MYYPSFLRRCGELLHPILTPKLMIFVLYCLGGVALTPPLGAQCSTCPSPNCNPLTECDFGGVPKDPCKYPGTSGCDTNYLPGVECCCWNSPILIDVDGGGFKLSSAQGGVLFDIVGLGRKSIVAWPKAGSTNGWLALDRNGNGTIDDVTELFGNRTAQPQPPQGVVRNGFRALAVFDQPAEGGNGNGRIDASDLVYSRLRIWQDLNRNGISEAQELKTLHQLGIDMIDLDHKASIQIDEYGNRFVFRAKVYGEHRNKLARWCWDVVPRSTAGPIQ